MPSSSIEKLLREFENELRASKFPPEVKERVPIRLRQREAEHRALPKNQDGRGTKHSEKHLVERTLKRLRRAVGHAYAHSDSNVRREARALVRSPQTLAFDKVAQRSSKFVGLLRRAGHRREERRRLVSRPNFSVSGLEVAELVSSDQLRSTGRELELCVARASGLGGRYHRALRSGNSKFYRLAQEEKAIGLVEVDVDAMRISDAQGPANGALRLSRKTALDLLRRLEATADYVEAFACVGAFSEFLEGTPIVRRFFCAGYSYGIWAFPDTKRIALKKTRANGRKSTWSLFERQDPTMRTGRRRRLPRPLGTWEDCCYPDGAMCIGEFTDLLIRCPEIAEIAGKAT